MSPTRQQLIFTIAFVTLLPLSLPLQAASIVADGTASEWQIVNTSNQNFGMIQRTQFEDGYFVWTDAVGDYRDDLTLAVNDIRTFAVSSDAENLYFLVQLSPGADPSISQVQIAIDTDLQLNSGTRTFWGGSETEVDGEAAWEYLVVTRFGSASASPAIYTDGSFTDLVSAEAINAIHPTAGSIEIAIPWSDLGTSLPPTSPLRFTVATFYCDSSDMVTDIGGAGISNVVDVISNYGDFVQHNTWDEVSSDASIDYYFDLYFNLNGDGEIASPLLITELGYDTDEEMQEWAEISNISGSSIELSSYRFGDEESFEGMGEGMLFFPVYELAAGNKIVVARSGSDFEALFGYLPNLEINNTSAAPELINDSQWGDGNVVMANGGDEILLLDSHATLLDVVTYDGKSLGGVLPHTGCNKMESLQRSPDRRDTNNCELDFQVQTVPSPGSSGESCLAGVSPYPPLAEGVPCDDGLRCTLNDACNATGTCTPGDPVICEPDGNDCTNDLCDPLTGLCNLPLAAGAACAGSDPCLGPNTCDGAGLCLNESPITCPAPVNECQLTLCVAEAGGCFAAAETPCEDGDRCTVATNCDDSGNCGAGQEVVCPTPTNDCQLESCNSETGCFASSGSTCNDGNACTTGDSCDGEGGCTGVAAICPDNGPCQLGVCDPESGECAFEAAPDNTTCDDLNPCTSEDHCSEGSCVGTEISCESDQCKSSTCDPESGECVALFVVDGTPCDDEDECTAGEICQQGECYGGTDICSQIEEETLDQSEEVESEDTASELESTDELEPTETIETESKPEESSEEGCGCSLRPRQQSESLLGKFFFGLALLVGLFAMRRRQRLD